MTGIKYVTMNKKIQTSLPPDVSVGNGHDKWAEEL